MRTNTNGKQAIAGHAASRKTGTAGTGQGQEQGQSNGAGSGASGAVCDGVRGTPTPKDGTGFRLSAVKALRAMCGDNTGSRKPLPLDLTERLTVQIAIETELHAVRKASRADFERGQRAIIRQCLALPFLDADARRRLSACPLPTKGERITELQELQNFVR